MNQLNKRAVWKFWQELENASVDELGAVTAKFVSADHLWHGPDPVNDLSGVDNLVSGFWKLDNDRYIENWVFVDMVHLFRQFGIDLFARLHAHNGPAS